MIEKIASEIASKGVEKTSQFSDSKRPTEGNVESPKLNDGDHSLKNKRFSDSERPSNRNGLEKPVLTKSETDAKKTNPDSPILNYTKEIIQNKLDGLEREKEVAKDLEKQYPPEKGYEILSEVYLRDENGNIVKDPTTGEARRIDFVVVKDGKVVDSVEVTSKTADKTKQLAKEDRIKDAGGNYIQDSNGNLIKIPSNVNTRVERRD
jgi:hypothetical protein